VTVGAGVSGMGAYMCCVCECVDGVRVCGFCMFGRKRNKKEMRGKEREGRERNYV
jgi:hypothetical protein